jgi:tRNA (guanine-N1)-methyltransferase
VRINVVTIFPETMDAFFATGMLAVAGKKGIVEYRTVSPRAFAADVHRTVDDAPFGGGPGMVMMAPPIVEAVESLGPRAGSPVILMSPAGARFDQDAAHRLAKEAELTFICGRYKGVDERVRELIVTEEISIGDFVLSGGEIAAAAVIEAVVRLKAEVLGLVRGGAGPAPGLRVVHPPGRVPGVQGAGSAVVRPPRRDRKVAPPFVAGPHAALSSGLDRQREDFVAECS